MSLNIVKAKPHYVKRYISASKYSKVVAIAIPIPQVATKLKQNL